MSPAMLRPMLPLVILCVSALLLILAAAFYRRRRLLGALAAGGFALTLAAAAAGFHAAPQEVAGLFLIDRYALFYLAVVAAAALAASLFASSYSTARPAMLAELFALLTLAALGAAAIVCSTSFVSFFVGLELLSVSLYPLIAYLRTPAGLEAGLKYLVLSAAASAFLLFGVALIYFQFGTLHIPALLAAQPPVGSAQPWLYAGLALLIVGIGFKLALAPFHMWAADIYQGAPAPVAAFVATASKGAVFAFALRYLPAAGGGSLSPVITVIAVASMFVGNLLALFQQNVKRLLAYSSIAQAGYVLVAFQAGGSWGLQAAGFYLVAYFVAILGAFGVIAALAADERECEMVDDYQGMAWRRPLLALVFAVMLFSLAGIPLTAGFIGKFYLLSAGVRGELWLLVFSLLASSVIGLFYYLRLIAALYRPAAACTAAGRAPAPLARLLLCLLALAVIAAGAYPGPLVGLVMAAF